MTEVVILITAVEDEDQVEEGEGEDAEEEDEVEGEDEVTAITTKTLVAITAVEILLSKISSNNKKILAPWNKDKLQVKSVLLR
jgi:hypothetical protein